ncbi:hypothetical protein SDC9_52474 [bioreactor metagenome]|uniref:Uncharacterized protein n=1 Tax=bioreactor metagenome TaxID=1076179 RepID=A0A644WRU0_9ZZZZ
MEERGVPHPGNAAARGVAVYRIGPVGDQMMDGPLPLFPGARTGKGAGFRSFRLFRHDPDARFEGYNPHGHLFLQKLPKGQHGPVPHKALLHDIVLEGVVDGEQTHPQVMSHIAPHGFKRGFSRPAALGIIHRLEKAVFPLDSHFSQTAQIGNRTSRSKLKGQEGGIGGNHQFGVQTPLQPQPLHPVGLILIIERTVKRVKGGLGDSPGNAQPGGPSPLHKEAEGQ